MTTFQILIDETVPASLQLAGDLNQVATVDRVDTGDYRVTGHPRDILDVTSAYPEAVLKLERLR